MEAISIINMYTFSQCRYAEHSSYQFASAAEMEDAKPWDKRDAPVERTGEVRKGLALVSDELIKKLLRARNKVDSHSSLASA